MFCESCGTQIPDEAQFCASCGSPQHDQPADSTSRPRPGGRRNLLVALFLVMLAALLIGGGALLYANQRSEARARVQAERLAAAEKAIEAVGKIDAAVGVGVNYNDYSAKLQDAAAAVEGYTPSDETGTKIKQALAKAVVYFSAASDAWNADNQDRFFTGASTLSDYETRDYWLGKYPEMKLPEPEPEDKDSIFTFPMAEVGPDDIRQAAWVVAGTAYESAKKAEDAYRQH